MFKINDFVWVHNVICMSFGVIVEVPTEKLKPYIVQLVHVKSNGIIKGSTIEVYESGLSEGVKHLKKKMAIEEQILRNKKLLLELAERRNILERI